MGCSSIQPRIDVKILEYETIPPSYFVGPECTWDGDISYGGLINEVKMLQHCIEELRTKLRQIAEWEAGQIEVIRNKKKELGVE
jgi:hypothetical protein